MMKKKRVVKCRVELDGVVYCCTGKSWQDEANQVVPTALAQRLQKLAMEQDPVYAAEIILNTVEKTSSVRATPAGLPSLGKGR